MNNNSDNFLFIVLPRPLRNAASRCVTAAAAATIPSASVLLRRFRPLPPPSGRLLLTLERPPTPPHPATCNTPSHLVRPCLRSLLPLLLPSSSLRQPLRPRPDKGRSEAPRAPRCVGCAQHTRSRPCCPAGVARRGATIGNVNASALAAP